MEGGAVTRGRQHRLLPKSARAGDTGGWMTAAASICITAPSRTSRITSRALDAGDVACLQLRLKDAPRDEVKRAIARLMPIAQKRDVAFILNDDAPLAAEMGCDGASGPIG